MAISDVTLLIDPTLEKKEAVIRNLVEELSLFGANIPIAITGRSEKPVASYLSLAACCSQWLRMNKKNKK